MKSNSNSTKKLEFNSLDVCLQMLEVESESELQDIILATPLLSDNKNWLPVDGRETNFNVTSNQASDGGKALTELMTNMVDAVLMKHAFQKGLDPKKDPRPQTMYEAVDKLIKNIQGGKLVNLDRKDPWLRKFSQDNLVIGITGAKTKSEGHPCYTFVDNGEGQNPERFRNTFLSLSDGNKKDIPFVQGKFNMGSSGVLGYCGKRWFKLIVSRRYDGKGDWGWTLVRKRPSNSDSLPVAEFFVLPDGSIPSFQTDTIFPFRTMAGTKYAGVSLKTGTIIKLYDYKVDSKYTGFKGREALNENLVETILPFRILDFRHLPKSKQAQEKAKQRGEERAEGIDARPFYGMEFLLLRSHKENDLSDNDNEKEDDDDDNVIGEDKLFVGNIEDPELGKISVSAIPLKREIPGWLKGSNNRVFHAVNGQVQFKQTRGYISQTCGLPALKDRVVIVVDASNLTFSAHNEIWKGDREHIRITDTGERYKDLVTEIIKKSESLKDLQNKIAQQELENSAKSESNSLFQKLVDADRNLAGLLSFQNPTIRLPASGGLDKGADKGKSEFEDSKYNPTFVRFENYLQSKSVLEIPINKTKPLDARTDAENGYLNRADNPGKVLTNEEIRKNFRIREHLYNGRLVLYLEPIADGLNVGDAFSLKVGLQDDSMASPVETTQIIIKITEPQIDVKPEKPDKPDKPPISTGGTAKDKSGKGQDAPTHGLPMCKLLTWDGRAEPGYEEYVFEKWPDGFTKDDGGTMENLTDTEIVYKINFDNAYHIKYRQQARNKLATDTTTQKYILGMRILMLGFEQAYRALKASNNNAESIAEFEDSMRRVFSQGAASTVLALAEYLPKIVDASAKPEDE